MYDFINNSMKTINSLKLFCIMYQSMNICILNKLRKRFFQNLFLEFFLFSNSFFFVVVLNRYLKIL